MCVVSLRAFLSCQTERSCHTDDVLCALRVTAAYVRAVWPPTRRAAAGAGAAAPRPLTTPRPAVRRNVVTRRPTVLLAWLAAPRNRRASISRSGRRFDSKPSRQWQLRGAEGEASAVGGKGSLTDEGSSDRRSIAAQAKTVPAGHYKSSSGDAPLAPNGAAEFTRRAVARALQEGTRARTSGGAARRGSDVGGRATDLEAPASRRSGRGGSLPNGAAALMLEGVVMRWIFVLYHGERAFYAGVLFWYSTEIKGDVRRGDNRKDTHGGTSRTS